MAKKQNLVDTQLQEALDDPDSFMELYATLMSDFEEYVDSDDQELRLSAKKGIATLERIKNSVRDTMKSVMDGLPSPLETHTVIQLDAIDTAKVIRVALKKAFPRTKFYVRTEHSLYVKVAWQDGPTEKDVLRATGPLEGLGIDGMVDLTYQIYHWRMPNGTLQPAYSEGTERSRGSVPGFHNPKPDVLAKLVRLGTHYTGYERAISADFAERLANVINATTGIPIPPIHQTTWFVGGKEKGEAVKFDVNYRDPNERIYSEALVHYSETKLNQEERDLPAA